MTHSLPPQPPSAFLSSVRAGGIRRSIGIELRVHHIRAFVLLNSIATAHSAFPFATNFPHSRQFLRAGNLDQLRIRIYCIHTLSKSNIEYLQRSTVCRDSSLHSSASMLEKAAPMPGQQYFGVGIDMGYQSRMSPAQIYEWSPPGEFYILAGEIPLPNHSI